MHESHLHAKFNPAQSLKPRFGVGYEDPEKEIFADGTPSVKRPIRDAHSSEVVSLMRSGKIRNNPPAGEVRRVELNGQVRFISHRICFRICL